MGKDLYLDYLRKLPADCKSHIILHPTKPTEYSQAVRLAKEWFAARVSKTALDGGSCRMNLAAEGGREAFTGGLLTSIGDGFEEPSEGVMNAVHSGGGKNGGASPIEW